MVSGKHFLFFDAELNFVYYDFNTDLLLTKQQNWGKTCCGPFLQINSDSYQHHCLHAEKSLTEKNKSRFHSIDCVMFPVVNQWIRRGSVYRHRVTPIFCISIDRVW